MVVASLAVVALRRSSAATRQRAWFLGAVCLLLLPVMAAGPGASRPAAGPEHSDVRAAASRPAAVPNYGISGRVVDVTPDYSTIDYDGLAAARTEAEFMKAVGRPRPEGRPAGGAVVRVKGESISKEATCDGAGRFRIGGLPARRTYEISAEAPSHLSRPGENRLATATVRVELDGPRQLDLQLRADRAVVRGRILDRNGQPIAGAKVRGEPYPMPDTQEITPPTRYAVSGADGVYELRDLAGPGDIHTIAGFLNGGDPTQGGMYAFSVEVFVEAEDYAQPAAGVPRVPLVTEDVLVPARRYREAFLQAARAMGKAKLRDERKDLGLRETRGNVITGVDVVLDRRPSGRVSGRLVDTKGNPRPSRVLSFTMRRDGPGAGHLVGRVPDVTTGEGGAFSVPRMPPGPYSIQVNGPPPNGWNMYQNPVENRTFNLEPGGSLQDLRVVIHPPEDFAVSGHVRDAKGGPVRNLYVSTPISTGFGWSTMTDQAGAYRLEGLDGTELTSFRINFGNGLCIPDVPMNARNVDLLIPGKGTINGTFHGSAAAVPASLEVTVPIVRLKAGGAIWEKPAVRVERKPDGHFTIADVPAGEARVVLGAEGRPVGEFTVAVEAGQVATLECHVAAATAPAR
jgi:hypothetical protein